MAPGVWNVLQVDNVGTFPYNPPSRERRPQGMGRYCQKLHPTVPAVAAFNEPIR